MLTECQVNFFVMKLLLPPLCTCMGHMAKWLRAWVPASAKHKPESLLPLASYVTGQVALLL